MLLRVRGVRRGGGGGMVAVVPPRRRSAARNTHLGGGYVPSDRLVGRGHLPGAQETDGLRPRRLLDGPLVIVGIVYDKPVGCRGDGRGAGARAVPGASTTPSTRLSSDGPALLIARPLAGICEGGSPRQPPSAAAAGGEADPPPITAPARRGSSLFRSTAASAAAAAACPPTPTGRWL